MRLRWFPSGLWVAAVALVLGFGFLGTRPIWDPDEGRYTNVALNMLDTGDWIHPQRSDHAGHWTKPPMTYWAIAASVDVFGRNPWAARLPTAASFLFCVFLAWRIGRRLAPGAEHFAALAFATMFVPAFTSQIITTDYLLTALQTLAMAAFVEARFGPPALFRRWISLMWLAFALGFMTKGPPALLPLAAILVFEWLCPQTRRSRLLFAFEALIFFLVALPWYVVVIVGQPKLLEYFVGAEVVGRFASDQFDRHGEWYGWLKIYGGTLLFGTLPWTGLLLRWVRGLPKNIRWWRVPETRAAQQRELFLALWILLPLAVFCVAQSRMPLYVLPLFVPLAIVVAKQWQAAGRVWPRLHSIIALVVLYMAIRLGAAVWPTHKDAGAWADAIRMRVSYPVTEVLFVEDMARYGINLHLDAEIEKISIDPQHESGFNPRFDEALATELMEEELGTVYVAKADRWQEISARISALGYDVVALGEPFLGRVIFNVVKSGQNATARSRPAADEDCVTPGKARQTNRAAACG